MEKTVQCAWSHALLATALFTMASGLQARNYQFTNISDLAGGPGGGRSAEINDNGDIAFLTDDAVWFYDRSANSFQNITAISGAPANPFFLKLNNNGDIAIVETPSSTRDLWLFEQGSQSFTRISGLTGYPGNSQSSFPLTTFDLNDNRQISFHSGDNNFGTIYIYDHATSSFDWINGKPGATTFGRENEINNLGQVVYMGFPSTYLYDPATNTTTNINTLPGGPGPVLTNLDLNDHGDVALTSANVATLYDASSGTFLDIDATPGWPPNITSSSRSDLGNGGEVTFWREGQYVFDSNTLRFSQLNGFPGGPPAGGTETDLNSSGEIALSTSEDVFLLTPQPFGDYDNDGDVDEADLTTWQASYGEGVAIGTAADGNSDGLVNGRSFLVWQRNYGAGLAPPEIATIPEPGVASFLTVLMVMGLSARLRRAPPHG